MFHDDNNDCDDGSLPLSDPGRFLGHAETHARHETEREIAARLAVLELLDPFQKRPKPKPSALSHVAFIDL
jgi:hypothetical protein